jgi:hypothetical protein
MSSKWFWKPVLVSAVILGVLSCLLLALLLAALSGGFSNYSADTLIRDLVTYGLPASAVGALIGAGFGALFAVIRKRVRGTAKEASQSE